MSLLDLLKDKVEKQMSAYNERLEAAEAGAKARKAQAEADVAGAELEQQILGEVNQLKDKLAEGQAFLQELADAGDEKADELKSKIANFFD